MHVIKGDLGTITFYTPTLILMRGLPGSGKTTRARELLQPGGLIFSADDFWHTQVNPDRPSEYSFDAARLPEAHAWCQEQVRQAMADRVRQIIVDNTNVRRVHMEPYALMAQKYDYELQIEEPTSPIWRGIRPLLKSAVRNGEDLWDSAHDLEQLSAYTHAVPFAVILRMMGQWED